MNEKIIFCGDLVIPFETDVNFEEVKELFRGVCGIANLEGAILPERELLKKNRWNDKFSLYNCPNVIDIIEKLNIKYASLCNNHILDYDFPVSFTSDLLSKSGVMSFGLNNHDVLEVEFNARTMYIITFASFASEHSFKLFNPNKVIRATKELRQNFKDAYIVIYPHWGIEKFFYPEPADRQLAHSLVDAGANLIVGHHPHVIQPVETYKGVTIAYSLGNFILPQTYYGNKQLIYKEKETLDELVLEWDGDDVRFHTLHYDRDRYSLSISKSFDFSKIDGMIDGLSDESYRNLYNSKVSLKNALRTRYSVGMTAEYLNYWVRKMLRTVRKVAITLKLHDPYKNVTEESGV